jgi:uncharacterized delta-60 repeat protein
MRNKFNLIPVPPYYLLYFYSIEQLFNRIKKKGMKNLLLVSLVWCGLVTSALAQGGTPDPSFGENGLAIWDNIGKTDAFYNMALSADGKIFLGGYTEDNTKTNTVFIQLDSKGQPNTAFGDNGKVIIDPNSTDGFAEDIIVDGNNVYVAYFSSLDDVFSGPIAKYDITGKLDTTFGESGIKNIMYTSFIYYPKALTIDNQENLYILATRGGNFIVMKMDKNGVVDESFGDNGVFFHAFDAGFANVRDISLQADGSVLIVGENFISSSTNPGSNLVIFRINPTGNLDETFNQTGLKTIAYGDGKTYTGDKIFWSDQEEKVLIIGSQYTGIFDGLVLKLNRDGSNDNSFGDNGMVIIEEVSQPLYDGFKDLEGRYIVVGDDYVIRLTSTGEKDMSFGMNGIVSDNYNIYSAVMDAAGNYLVAGSYYNGNDLDGIVAKYYAENISSSTKDAYNWLSDIELTPNPFVDHINISIYNQENLASANIVLYNMMGMEVFRSSVLDLNYGVNQVLIDKNLSGLVPQTYVLSIITKQGITSQKITKIE